MSIQELKSPHLGQLLDEDNGKAMEIKINSFKH